jgi:hypothetical protein
MIECFQEIFADGVSVNVAEQTESGSASNGLRSICKQVTALKDGSIVSVVVYANAKKSEGISTLASPKQKKQKRTL